MAPTDVMHCQCAALNWLFLCIGDSSFESCEFLRVLGVVGMDVGGDEFRILVSSSLASTNCMQRVCSSGHYPCFSDETKTCQTL